MVPPRETLRQRWDIFIWSAFRAKGLLARTNAYEAAPVSSRAVPMQLALLIRVSLSTRFAFFDVTLNIPLNAQW